MGTMGTNNQDLWLLPELNPAEVEQLKGLERVIQSGLATFVSVGAALATIRDSELYRETHPTFEEYCREKWGMAVRTAQQTMLSAQVVRTMSLPDGIALPNESTARVLARIDNPSARKEAWIEAIGQMPDVTAKDLEHWLRRRYHIKQPIPSARPCTTCPKCGHKFEYRSLAALSRGNRKPSPAPSWFYETIGKVESAADYGCGRLRNALEIEKGANRVVYLDLPEQLERLADLAGNRLCQPVPLTSRVDVTFLIQVLHICDESAQRPIALNLMEYSNWIVVETPADQPHYKKKPSKTFRWITAENIGQLFGVMPQASRWLGAHNRAYLINTKASH